MSHVKPIGATPLLLNLIHSIINAIDQGDRILDSIKCLHGTRDSHRHPLQKGLRYVDTYELCLHGM
jgi:hypothetical protein